MRNNNTFFVAHQKEGIGQPKKVQHHIGGGQQQKTPAKSSKLFLGGVAVLLHIDVVLIALDLTM